MARIVRVRRGMSLFDATLLVSEFERVKEQGYAEDDNGEKRCALHV